jgi:hemin uptake protein HemP
MASPGDNERPAETGAQAAKNSQRQAVSSPHVVDSASLLAGQSQVAILHRETIYFLRQTRFGKLILTK